MMRSDRDGVQIAKAHRTARHGMMTRRPHEGESFLTAEGQVDRLNRCSGSAPGVDIDPGIVGSIAVKIDRLPQPRKMIRVMRHQNLLF
jgi:hypothetical protein